jgi:hypothetical protein
MESGNPEAIKAINEAILRMTENVKAIADVANRLIADRVEQDPTSISFDAATDSIVGILSDAARAAKEAMERALIAKGVEGPGQF